MGIKSTNRVESYYNYFAESGKDAVTPAPPPPFEATGGVISDYESSGTKYRAHIFNTPGTFTAESSTDVEILVVGGGGGGSGGFPSFGAGKGGGAGGMAVATSYPVVAASYPITVGESGRAAIMGPGSAPYQHIAGINGGDSVFTNPSAPLTITGKGGGGAGGGARQPGGSPWVPYLIGRDGGSGGGGGWAQGGSVPQVAAGSATQPTQNPGIPNLTNYGNDGGAGNTPSSGWGGTGGGAGGAGVSYPSTTGGPAQPNDYATGSAIAYATGGKTGDPISNLDSFPGSGDGGQGWGNDPSPGTGSTDGFAINRGGYGGGGTVIVRYQISALGGTAKASGGLISYYNGKVIHTFASPGTFTTDAGFNETIEYVIIGGGGAGGAGGGMSGGGGAGTYKTNTTPANTPTATPMAVTVGNGGGTATAKGWYTSTNSGPNAWSAAGMPSSVVFPAGTITSPGGGQGSAGSPSYAGGTANGYAGGSGGGGGGGAGAGAGSAGTGNGDPFPGTIGSTPTNGWGNDSGAGAAAPGDKFCGGGGGGAGGVGQDGQTPGPRGGCGGKGIQLPSTFRDPASTIGAPGPTTADTNGDTSGKFWVAGGGGGAQYNGTNTVTGGTGDDPTVGPYAGGGNASGGAGPGGPAPTAPDGQPGWANTGGGGGAGGGFFDGTGGASLADAGNGGSGLVLIAYPE